MKFKIINLLALVIAFTIPESALALPPPIICGIIPGCGQGPENVIHTAGVPLIAQILLNTAAVLSLIFVMVGGARLLLSFGNDDAFNRARQTIVWSLGGMITAIMSHRIVMIVISETYVTGGNPILDFLATVVNIMSMLLNVTFLIAVLIGGFRMVMARGKDEEVSKGKTMIIYAIIGTIIINLAPFIVRMAIAF
ncbi:hypothetical protein HOF56_02390 [Candidatus Peribacteria bacterium]|jgi:hypothetical protein|nr:hypothetical protein [Candidatus Peribacteria bacterium]MBT4021041.1 hypothetical protein [Candidatus Peribacteria bacterium]MBT4240762.1 hypothetical protein [Candidatus Peribacteria bacterium]MBT4474209.1 hypothetical protein [Candidatus Peribacteria bacterium]